MDTSHGWSAVESAVLRLAAVLCAGLPALLCDGCKSDPMDPFLAVEQSAARAGSVYGGAPFATRPLQPELLTGKDWYEKPPRSYAQRTEADLTWHHRRLDPYLHPSAPRTDLSNELLSPDPVVATNAAILAAHWGTAEPVEHLAAAIRAPQLPLPLRCASAEALGFIKRPSTAPTLRALLDVIATRERRQSPNANQGDGSGQTDQPSGRENPDLYATLIRALARRAEPEDQTWFTGALASSDWQVRLEGAAAWSALPNLKLPAQVIELRDDHDPRVRATVVRTIAAHREPQTVAYLQQALDDSDFDVRMAAMTALEEIGTGEARAVVDRMKDHAAGIQQAAAATSRAAKGFQADVQAAAADAHSQLRVAVAETLEQAERTGDQLVAETAARGQEAADRVAAEIKTAADATATRLREAQRLARSLREANLPEAARRQALITLERLAMDANQTVRVQAARAMGEVADPVFLPALVTMLSDEPDVQVAAMAALVVIAGTDVTAREGGRPLSSEEKVRLWRLWYEEHSDQSGKLR